MTNNFVKKTSLNQTEGWALSTENMDAFITEEGAQIAPVTFRWQKKSIRPYYLTPWQKEDRTTFHGALKNLRGEFFCMPFGGNAEPVNGEQHPAHGEVSGNAWSLASSSVNGDLFTVELAFSSKVRKAEVTKTIRINRNHPVLYFSHKIKNSSGSIPLGHHPILKMPENGGKMLLSTSDFVLGMTCPGVFSDPNREAYQILDRGKEFSSLEAIPSLTRDSESLDFSVYPSPYGFTDLFSVFKKSCNAPAWTVAVYPSEGYLWFSLKDPAVLPSTTFWVSRSGRFFAPWNGRTHCIGIEDTCSFFAAGLKSSVEHNFLNDRGFSTAISLDGEPEIRHIQGIASVPENFGKVGRVLFESGRISFLDIHGHRASVPVDYNFVMSEKK